MKQTKEDRLISEAYQHVIESDINNEGVMNKLKSLALAGAVAGSAVAAPNNFNVPFKSDKPILTSQTQNSPSAGGVIYKNNNWTAVQLHSKQECLIFSKDKHVQVSVDKDGTATINLSYDNRGGVSRYRLVVDGQPSEEQSDSNTNEVKIPFQDIQGGKTLKVIFVHHVGGTTEKVNRDTIDIVSLKAAISACQKAMAQ